MTAINLEAFGGMIPIQDERLLPNQFASLAENTWIYSGTVNGFHIPVPVHTNFNPATKKVYRIPTTYFDKDHIHDSFWMEFLNPDVDVIRSPTLGDQYERFYWAQSQVNGPMPPRYNTKERILAGQPNYTLGIPSPVTKPGLSSAGGAAPVESRVYVYTWVSTYGEEGPPSPPSDAVVGNANGTWNVTMTAPTAGDMANRSLAFTNIYRAVTTTTGTATYYFVAQVPIATLAYADTIPSTIVSQNRVLESATWTGPPADLLGMVSMPNGMIAGWRGSEIWFCEPYRPHAWPAVYVIMTEFPIIGLGVIGQTVMALTTGNPYAASGVNPGVMATSRLAQYAPCLSRGSIISTPVGVAYASADGLAVALPGEVTIVTRDMIGKEVWQDVLLLPTVRAAPLNGGYYAWGSVRPGCFEPSAFENTAFLQDDFSGAYTGGFMDLHNERVSYHKLAHPNEITENVITDHWTGEIFLIRGGQVYWLDISGLRDHENYRWRSKRFNMLYEKNLAAMKVWFDLDPTLPALNPVRDVSLEQSLKPDQWGLVRVYADERLCYTNELRKTGELMKLPTGFKAHYYSFEIEARCEVSKIEAASTVQELTSV